LTQATLLALAQRAPAGSAVYDVGAHIGLYAALIDAVYGRSPRAPRVIAFEPTPETAGICSGIRRHNGLGFELVESAGSLLVLGSSLTVMSGYRFVLRAAKLGIPVAIATLGPTRGDAKADVRVDAPLGVVLPALAARLAA